MTYMITCIEFLLSCFQFGRSTHVCMKEDSDGNSYNQLLKLDKNKDGVYITTPAVTHENFTQTPQLHRRSVLVGRLCFSVIQHSLSLFPLQSKARAEESNHKKEVAMDSVGRSFVKENSGGRTVKGASASQLGPE